MFPWLHLGGKWYLRGRNPTNCWKFRSAEGVCFPKVWPSWTVSAQVKRFMIDACENQTYLHRTMQWCLFGCITSAQTCGNYHILYSAKEQRCQIGLLQGPGIGTVHVWDVLISYDEQFGCGFAYISEISPMGPQWMRKFGVNLCRHITTNRFENLFCDSGLSACALIYPSSKPLDRTDRTIKSWHDSAFSYAPVQTQNSK